MLFHPLRWSLTLRGGITIGYRDIEAVLELDEKEHICEVWHPYSVQKKIDN